MSAGVEDAPGARQELSPGLTDEILASATAGDEYAFAIVYHALQPGLRRYAGALVGEDADDVTAEAWLHIARDVQSFQGDVNAFRAWTVRIVRNRAMDTVRYRARRPARTTPHTELLDTVAIEDTASDALERISTAAAADLIATLPQEQAEAVLLRAVVGLDARTAGEVLGKSAAAVRVASHRGLKRLAQTLAKSRPDLGGRR
jgi:RNA polymerase sigma-70 factor (ECF subfamily)